MKGHICVGKLATMKTVQIVFESVRAVKDTLAQDR